MSWPILEREAQGLGRRLQAEVLRAESKLRTFPESAREIVPGIRSQVLRKFPYSLIYTIDEVGIFILAVAHHHRHPAYWTSRMP